MTQHERATTSPFVGDFFCLIPHTRLAFAMVSKNAVTFLKRVALFHGTGEWNDDLKATHAIIGGRGKSPYLVPVSEMPAWEEEHGARLKFAVWRDPIRRIESAYSLFCLDGIYLPHLAAAALYVDPSEEHFRNFVRFETSKPKGWIESHFKPQSHVYTPDDVDEVIGIRDVRAFLDHHGVSYVDEESNASSHNDYRITDESWRAELRQIYAADYDIPITWRPTSAADAEQPDG